MDIHTDDSLGQHNVSTAGVLERDTQVIYQAKMANIPIACVIGGGYSKDSTQLSVHHSQVFIAVNNIWQSTS